MELGGWGKRRVGRGTVSFECTLDALLSTGQLSHAISESDAAGVPTRLLSNRSNPIVCLIPRASLSPRVPTASIVMSSALSGGSKHGTGDLPKATPQGHSDLKDWQKVSVADRSAPPPGSDICQASASWSSRCRVVMNYGCTCLFNAICGAEQVRGCPSAASLATLEVCGASGTLQLYMPGVCGAGFGAPLGHPGVCDRLPAAPRQRLIGVSGPLTYRKRGSSVIAACRRFVAWLGLTNLLCLQKALLGVTVAAVILAGSAIVKKVHYRPSLALSPLAGYSWCTTLDGLRLLSLSRCSRYRTLGTGAGAEHAEGGGAERGREDKEGAPTMRGWLGVRAPCCVETAVLRTRMTSELSASTCCTQGIKVGHRDSQTGPAKSCLHLPLLTACRLDALLHMADSCYVFLAGHL